MRTETRTILVFNTNKVLSENSRDSMKDAARRWDVDFIEVTEPQPGVRGHHAGLKLRAFQYCDHDRILIIDSDTIIRSDTPSIFELAGPSEYLAVRNEQPHVPGPYFQANRNIAREIMEDILSKKTLPGKPIDPSQLCLTFFNSGVTVVSREHHSKVLDLGAEIYQQTGGGQWWDQIPLNMAVAAILGGYHDIGSMWNYFCPTNMGHMSAYIYHFAGDPSRYDKLKVLNWHV